MRWGFHHSWAPRSQDEKSRQGQGAGPRRGRSERRVAAADAPPVSQGSGDGGPVAIGAASQAGCGPADSAAQDPRRHRHDDRVPLLRGRLRPGRLHAGRQVVNIEGDPAPSRQRGHALQQGRGGHPGGEQPAAPAEGALPRARRHRVGREDLGLGPPAHRRARQGDARQDVPDLRGRADRRTARRPSPASAARRSTTRRPISS